MVWREQADESVRGTRTGYYELQASQQKYPVANLNGKYVEGYYICRCDAYHKLYKVNNFAMKIGKGRLG